MTSEPSIRTPYFGNRRAWFAYIGGALLAAAAAHAPAEVFVAANGPFQAQFLEAQMADFPQIQMAQPNMAADDIDFVDRAGNWQFAQRRVSEAQARSQIISALQRPKTGDPVKWRDAEEDALVAIGETGLPAMHTELAQRTGPERDALEGAIFRLEHADLDVPGALRAWGVKRFGLEQSPDDPAKALTLAHIGGVPAGLFPHHIFYFMAPTGKAEGAVVALAEDGKVQPVEDDAAILKFIRGEAEYDPEKATRNEKNQLAQAAAALAAGRAGVPTRFEAPQSHVQQSSPPDAKTSQWEILGNGVDVTATVTFDDKGKLMGVTTTSEKVAQTMAAPDAVTTAPFGRGIRGRGRGPVPPPPPVEIQPDDQP